MGTRDEDIDRWLARVLPVPPAKRVPASGDASFRRYFRIDTADGSSRIVMDAPPQQEDCRPFIDIARRLRGAGVKVPHVFAHDLDQGFMLLEDLGAEPYLQRLGPDSSPALYRDALAALVRIQAHAETRGLPAYDSRRLHTEMDLFHQWFVPKHLQVALSAAQRRALRATQELLVDACLEQPQVFVHRDYHSRNLMVLAQHNPGILDFQDAVLGPISYDVVSLLRDVYVEWPDSQVASWLGMYATLAQEQAVLQATQQAKLARWFDLTGVQRHLKIAGIFSRLFYRDGKPRYLEDLPLTLRYLHAICERYPELSSLAAVLRDLDVHRASAAASARCVDAVSGS